MVEKLDLADIVYEGYNHVLFCRCNIHLDLDCNIVNQPIRHGRYVALFSSQGFELEIASDRKVWFGIFTTAHSGIRWVEVLNDDQSKAPSFGEMTPEYQERMRTKWRMADERKQGAMERQGIMIAMASDTLEMVSGAEIWPPL